jgi:hypothetical protein
MECCEGVRDWLKCLRCEYLCTSNCPIEGENAFEELLKRLKLAESKGKV